MPDIEQVKLSEFFRSVKKPRYVLGTTYTLSLAFFESVVFSCIPRRDLKYCLIISDANGYHRALDEGAALQGAAQGYMVVPAPVSGCFHAKVWLVIGESEASLLVGSGNLTQSGFMTNAELFDSLHFTADQRPTQEQAASIIAFLAGLASMWSEEDRAHLLCVDMLAEMRRQFSAVAGSNQVVSQGAPIFIHSFDGPLISQLPEASVTSDLYVAAPYFGNSVNGLTGLRDRYSPANTYVFPAVHGTQATDFPGTAVEADPNVTLARLSVKGKKTSFAHLKLYGVSDAAGDAWLCCTSANCTEAAWQNKNIEAGLVRRLPNEMLATYFVADKKALPEGEVDYGGDEAHAGRLHLWATESGMGIDITTASDSIDRLPLQDVALILRIGSKVVALSRSTMFAGGRTEHVLWAAFEGIRRERSMAICLEIQAKDASGGDIRGACFVENRMLLTADPIHRSAWRGALALLDSQSMPDLSDIAAIFTLVSNIFDGRLVARVTTAEKVEKQADDEDDENAVVHVPVWPPTADTQDLHHRIGTTGLGQLALCQKILSTLLKPQVSQAKGKETQPSLDESEGDRQSDGQDTEAAQRAREEVEARTKKLAQHLWDRADRDYRHLHHRLQTLCPGEELAPNIWPAAIFVFLATAAVHRATSRVAANIDDKISMHHLIDQFVRLMLNDRRQPDDFCCPKGFRYRSDDQFPPLASDLKATFDAKPDIDLATVMVAVLVAHKMHIAPGNEYPILWQRYLRQFLGDDFEPTDDFQVAVRRIWSQYLHEDTNAMTDDDFNAACLTMWHAYREGAG